MLMIAYPFRFKNGSTPKVDSMSESGMAQTVANIVRIHKGELFMRPEYGTLEPEFYQIDSAGIFYSVSEFHPYIAIDSIESTIAEDGEVSTTIGFSGEGL